MRQRRGFCLSTAALAFVVLASGAAMLAQSAAGQAGTVESLKSLAPKSLLIGAAINQRVGDGADAANAAIVETHFTTVTPENLLKWGPVHPEPARYNFEPADRYVAYGEQHGLAVIGHTLVWHQQTPRWVFAGESGGPADRETLLRRMREHISTVVGRYKGRVRGWDVVNEALDEDGTLRKTPWLDIIGEDFIAKAFEYAREADPNAELYYNDYNLWKPAKLQGAIRIVKKLKTQGLRVDAIGEQGHWLISEPPVPAIDAMLSEIEKAGFKAVITELDVDVLPRDEGMYGADLSKQQAYQASTNLYPTGLPDDVQVRLAQRYADIFRVFLKHRAHVGRVTFWGVTDATSWLNGFPIRGRVNYPLLFDRQGQPKPAFKAVAGVLKETR
jgi:endo-1,4-beta-xylanase